MSNEVKNGRIEIQILPFSGFYESWESESVDHELESYIENLESESDLPKDFDVWNADIDYSAIWNDYAKAYVEAFVKYCDVEFNVELDLQFSELTSPSYYNFETDKLWATLPVAQLAKIRKEVESYPEWSDKVKERHSSRDGFTSFISDDVNDEEWTAETLAEVQYGTIIQAWVEHNLRANDSSKADELDYVLLNDAEASILENIEVYSLTGVELALNAIDAEIEKQRKLETKVAEEAK
jgi:hypothetical protein